jgi:site-specific recombinase XerD
MLRWLDTKVDLGQLTLGTADGQRHNLCRFATHVGPQRPVAEITTDDFVSWLRTLRNHAVGSQITKAAPVRAYFAWAHATGLIPADPCKPIPRPKKPQQDPKALTVDQLDRLLNAPTSRATVFRDRTIIITVYALGLRVGEVAKLRVEHWDRDAGVIKLHRKGGKVTTQPVVGDLEVVLGDWVSRGLWGATSGPMWPSPRIRGEGLARSYIGAMIPAFGREVGVTLTAHQLRHTIATFLARDGVPESIIKEFLDHESAESTAIYTRANKVDVRRALETDPEFLRFPRQVRASGGQVLRLFH